MKLAVFTVMLPDMIPEEAAQELQTAGYHGVEWRVTRVREEQRREPPSFWGNNHCTLAPTLEEAHRARSLSEAHGLAIPNLGTYIDFGDVAAVEEAMQFAQAAGSPLMRVRSASLASAPYSQRFAETQAFLTAVERLARQYGVKAVIEMHHGTITPSASLAHRLISRFDPEVIGVIYDPGNLVYEGFEDYRMGLELLGPYLAHVHIKNAAYQRPPDSGVWKPTWAPLEDGVVDFHAFFAALRGVGYDGWLSVEDFSQVRSSREALRFNLAFIQSILNQIR